MFGSFTHRFHNVSKIEQSGEKYSPASQIGCTSWLMCMRIAKDTVDKELEIVLFSIPKVGVTIYTTFEIAASYQFCIESHWVFKKGYYKKGKEDLFYKRHCSNAMYNGVVVFKQNVNLLLAGQFVKDDSITCHVSAKLLEVSENLQVPTYNFADEFENSDLILKYKGYMLFVHTQILVLKSEIMKQKIAAEKIREVRSTYQSRRGKKGMMELTLQLDSEVTFDDFVIFLNLLYNANDRLVTEDNVVNMLKLSVQMQAPTVLKFSEQFFFRKKKLEKITEIEVIILCFKFKLENLKVHMFSKNINLDIFAHISLNEDYQELPTVVKTELCEFLIRNEAMKRKYPNL